MRKIIAQSLNVLFIDLIALYLVAYPVYAFNAASSTTGYVRVATSNALVVYQAANRVAFTTAIASAVTAPALASVAVRVATGPVGWAALGVSAALTLAQMYYSQSDIAAVKTAASTVNPNMQTYTYQGQTYTVGGYTSTTGIPACSSGIGYFYPGTNGSTPAISPGMTHSNFTGWWCFPPGNQAALTPPTQQNVTDYLTGLSPANANSPESHTTPVGQGVSSTPADNVTTVQVSPEQVVPTVKPASQVLPTDAVIDPNAPPPTGPQAVPTPATTTTTTTTTTTNPNGSTTTQQTDDPGVVSCNIGHHDQRTFGSVLQDHMNLWGGSGLAGALNLIKNLAWPEAIPTYAISSNTFGNFTLDFSGWSGVLLALRGLVIAMASFVAYRIIFVGSK